MQATPSTVTIDNTIYTFGKNAFTVYDRDSHIKTVFRVFDDRVDVTVTEGYSVVEQATIVDDQFTVHNILKEFSLSVTYNNGERRLIVLSGDEIDSIVITPTTIVQSGVSDMTNDPDYQRIRRVVEISERRRLEELLQLFDQVVSLFKERVLI